MKRAQEQNSHLQKNESQRVIKVYVYPSFFHSLWLLFRLCASASVWVTHREVGGSTTGIESLSRTRLFPPHLREQPPLYVSSFSIEQIADLDWSKRSYWSQCGFAYENYPSLYTYSPNGVVTQKTNIALYFLFSLLMYVCSNLLVSDRTITSNSCGLA